MKQISFSVVHGNETVKVEIVRRFNDAMQEYENAIFVKVSSLRGKSTSINFVNNARFFDALAEAKPQILRWLQINRETASKAGIEMVLMINEMTQ